MGIIRIRERGDCLITKMVQCNSIRAWVLDSNDTAMESWLCQLTNCDNQDKLF